MNLTDMWGKGQPDNLGGIEDCGALVSEGFADAGRFNDIECNRTYDAISYICKTRQHRRILGEIT
jgi:hypothetical protein